MTLAHMLPPAPPVVAILGAGPAGMSCALWLKNLGLTPWLIDCADHAGGMMRFNFLGNNWVLGHQGHTGLSLAEQFTRHIEAENIALDLAARAQRIEHGTQGFAVRCEVGALACQQQCAAVVLATGLRYRGLEDLGGIPGVAALDAQQLGIGPYAFAQLREQSNKDVVVIGGGDNAIENARMLLEEGARVTLVARSAFRAQAHLMTAVAHDSRARLLANTQLQAVTTAEDGRLRLTVSSTDGVSMTLAADRLHLLLGYEPNSNALCQLFDDALWQGLQRDKQGYLAVDSQGRTSVAGLYAAGDICNPAFPSVVSALAQGAQVAKTIERDLRER